MGTNTHSPMHIYTNTHTCEHISPHTRATLTPTHVRAHPTTISLHFFTQQSLSILSTCPNHLCLPPLYAPFVYPFVYPICMQFLMFANPDAISQFFKSLRYHIHRTIIMSSLQLDYNKMWRISILDDGSDINTRGETLNILRKNPWSAQFRR